MKVQRFDWVGAAVTAAAVRSWSAEGEPPVEVELLLQLRRQIFADKIAIDFPRDEVRRGRLLHDDIDYVDAVKRPGLA